MKDAPLIYLLRILARRLIEDRCMQVASSLTFTTLLALVPVVTVLLTVASAFPVFRSLLDHLHNFVVQNLLPRSVATITTYAQQFSENAGHLTAVGVVILGVTALLLLFTIEGE
ncbi:MAG: YihY family inner membrane protein, partial [Sulfuricaulis sp.]|nr:YihY family inner membrane protein [Sulfuricaulis sp.]